ncbi:MAG: hypothetical protein Q4A16_05165 [Lautropia sp.]|nr:hypothetical protein [Lautropia sp.]
MVQIAQRIRFIAASLLAVMLFAVLHPAAVAISVIRKGPDASMIEVCTAHGVSWVRMDDSADRSPTVDITASPIVDGLQSDASITNNGYFHCPMCFLGDTLPPDFERPDLSFPLPGFVLPLSRNEPLPADTAALRILTAPTRAPPTTSANTHH